MSRSWFIAIPAGRWQRSSIREAQRFGCSVVAIDENPSADGFSDADFCITADLKEHDLICQQLSEMSARFVGVASLASDAGMSLAAVIRERFGLPGPDVETSIRFTDKIAQRQMLRLHGVPGPQFLAASSSEEATRAALTIGFPLIVKPSDSSGSRGVSKVLSFDDDFGVAVDRALTESKSSRAILEGYMEGIEFTVETFTIGGRHHVLATTEKRKVPGTRGLVAEELATPLRPEHVINRIQDTALRALTALRYVDGPGHTEVILRPDGTCGLVECAARGGGFGVFERFVEAVSGVDIVRLSVMQAAGACVRIDDVGHRFGVLHFIPSKLGTLVRIQGVEEANALRGLYVEAFARVGDRLPEVSSDGDRLGLILAVEDSSPAVQELAAKAMSMVEFGVRP